MLEKYCHGRISFCRSGDNVIKQIAETNNCLTSSVLEALSIFLITALDGAFSAKINKS